PASSAWLARACASTRASALSRVMAGAGFSCAVLVLKTPFSDRECAPDPVYSCFRSMGERTLTRLPQRGASTKVAPYMNDMTIHQKTPDTAPDFRGVDSWVFDLDHTLYTTSKAQDAEMEERICRFVQEHYQVPRDEAYRIQKTYL